MISANKKLLVVIEGPTASGKTALGVELASHFNSVVISADSRQFYKELAIGTAKPSLEEQKGIHHYFIDSHSLKDEITSSEYAKQVEIIVQDLFKHHDVVFMVGGSGMFIDAFCIGLDEIPHSIKVREELNLIFNEYGLAPLLDELKEFDPEYFNLVDRSNPMRIIRAIEAHRISGKSMTELRLNQKKTHPFEIKRFVINHARDILYDRINKRVDLMIDSGLLDEVKSVIDFKDLTPLKTVGYSELFSYLNDEISFERAVELIKQNTRRYAKRQLTWFRRHLESTWLKETETHKMKEEVISYITL
jgi:tRNA dimethylallyltransferase